MARIRTVKPELFRHEALFEAELASGLPLRLAFIGLFTVADREGRFHWRPRAMKLDVLPFDECDFSAVMDALASAGFVYRYQDDGKEYGFIPSWLRHQVINTREAKSTIPEPDEDSIETHMHARACTTTSSHVPRGVNVPQGLRETVFARDGSACLRCGAVDDLTIDHIFPQCLGGTHAITNLRTLCRACNSARPVQGQALLDDLAKDGLSMDDMQRTCMHVHAQGEGKGREVEGKGSGMELIPVDASNKPAKKQKTEKPKTENQQAAGETWNAYANAYFDRYKTEPVRNAKTNALISQLVQRLGAEAAPHVAGYFLSMSKTYYTSNLHPLGVLVKDCESIHTQWATNRQMTDTRARQIDQSQANYDVADEALRIYNDLYAGGK